MVLRPRNPPQSPSRPRPDHGRGARNIEAAGEMDLSAKEFTALLGDVTRA